MHKLETGEESDCKSRILVAMAAGVIVGNLMGIGLVLGCAASGWAAVVAPVVTIAGGVVVLWLVGRALRSIQARAVRDLRDRISHDDDVIESMGQDIQADEQRHAAEVVRLEGEIEWLRTDRVEMKRQHQVELGQARREGIAQGVTEMLAKLRQQEGAKYRAVRMIRRIPPQD